MKKIMRVYDVYGSGPMGLSEDKSNETFSKKNSDTWVQDTDESLQLPLQAVFSITNQKKKKRALNARNFYLFFE